MLAIFTDAAITVAGGIELPLRSAFTPFGTLKRDLFKDMKISTRR